MYMYPCLAIFQLKLSTCSDVPRCPALGQPQAGVFTWALKGTLTAATSREDSMASIIIGWLCHSRCAMGRLSQYGRDYTANVVAELEGASWTTTCLFSLYIHSFINFRVVGPTMTI